MFRIDDREIKGFERDLKAFNRRAFPFATKETLNQAAFTARKLSLDRITKKMIIRARYTKQSVQYEKAKGLNVRRQFSVIGSVAGYLEDQEFGGVRTKKGARGVPIPTSYSAGLGMGVKPRTRATKTPLHTREVRAKKGKLSGGRRGRRQQVLVAVRQAVQTGERTIYLRKSGAKKGGLYRVVGGTRGVGKHNKGWPEGASLKMLYNIDEASVKIPRNPWLKPSFDKTWALMPGIYRKALLFQLKRSGIMQ